MKEVTHLHSLAEVFSLALFGNDSLVNLAGGDVVVARQSRIYESFVVSEVKVRLPAVVEHEDLAVLERGHGAGVDVDVRVDLDVRYTPASRFEQHADAARRDTFTEAAHDTRVYGPNSPTRLIKRLRG